MSLAAEVVGLRRAEIPTPTAIPAARKVAVLALQAVLELERP